MSSECKTILIVLEISLLGVKEYNYIKLTYAAHV